jgi:protein subunit release factor A
MAIDIKDVHIHITDQRIGMGVGGLDTRMRFYHIPTEIMIELPNIGRSQWKTRELGLAALELLVEEAH